MSSKPKTTAKQPRKPKTLAEQKADTKQLCHIAANQLGWKAMGLWEDIKLRFGGHASTNDMNLAQLEAVLQHARDCGWKGKHKNTGKRRAAAPKSRPLDPREKARLIRAIWLQLRDLGEVRDADEAALAAWVKRQTKSDQHPDGIDALDWVQDHGLDNLIEAIKKWRMRVLTKKGGWCCPGTGQIYEVHPQNIKLWLAGMKLHCQCCKPQTILEWRRTAP